MAKVAGVEFTSTFPSSALLTNYNYSTIIPNFTQTTPSTLAYSLSATFPQLTSETSATLPDRQWAQGDAISVVNLSTKEILDGTLTAQAAGETATFTGNVQSVKGVNGGDELLILYPAIETTDTEFSELVYDLGQQSGESLETAPYVVAGTMVVKNGLPGEAVKMEYLTSVTGLNLNNLLATLPSTSRVRTMGSGSGEGYDDEDGSWGDEPQPYDFQITGVTVSDVPTKLKISYDATSGYAVSFENGALALDHGTMISKTDDDRTVYFAYPAISAAQTFGATVSLGYKLEVDEVEQSLTTSMTSTGATLAAGRGLYSETSLNF